MTRRQKDDEYDCDYDDEYDCDYDDCDAPLYPIGKLDGMSFDELEKELDRQCDRQGRLGEAEYINDRLVEETEMRCRVVADTIKRRKAAMALAAIIKDGGVK